MFSIPNLFSCRITYFWMYILSISLMLIPHHKFHTAYFHELYQELEFLYLGIIFGLIVKIQDKTDQHQKLSCF